MPWGAFWIVLLVTFVLQSALIRVLGLESLDLLLAFALFCGLTGTLHDARLAGWLIGLAQDMGSGGPVGVHAVGLGLSGLLLTSLRQFANMQVWWARLIVALLAALPGQFFVALHERYWQQAIAGSWWSMLTSVVFISTLAALVAGLLTQLPLFLGWDRRRRHYPRPRW